jgi:hypothetical protein
MIHTSAKNKKHRQTYIGKNKNINIMSNLQLLLISVLVNHFLSKGTFTDMKCYDNGPIGVKGNKHYFPVFDSNSELPSGNHPSSLNCYIAPDGNKHCPRVCKSGYGCQVTGNKAKCVKGSPVQPNSSLGKQELGNWCFSGKGPGCGTSNTTGTLKVPKTSRTKHTKVPKTSHTKVPKTKHTKVPKTSHTKHSKKHLNVM